jgi:hypothetical protein
MIPLYILFQTIVLVLLLEAVQDVLGCAVIVQTVLVQIIIILQIMFVHMKLVDAQGILNLAKYILVVLLNSFFNNKLKKEF